MIGGIGKNTRFIIRNIGEEKRRKRMRYLLSARKDGSKTAIRKLIFKTNSFFLSFLCVFGGLLADSRFTYAEAVPPLNNPSWADLGWTVINGSGVQLTDLSLYDQVQMDFGADANMDLANSCYEAILDVVDVSTGMSAGLDAETMVEHLGDKEWLDENGYEFKLDQQAWEIKALSKTELAKNGMKMLHDAALRQERPWYWDFGQIGEYFANNGKIAYEILFTDPSTGETIVETFASILDNVIDYFNPNIKTGNGIGFVFNSDAINIITNYQDTFVFSYRFLGGYPYRLYGFPSGVAYAHWNNGTNNWGIVVKNLDSVYKTYYEYDYNFSGTSRDHTVGLYADQLITIFSSRTDRATWISGALPGPEFANASECTTYLQGVTTENYNFDNVINPDIININTGNVSEGNKVDTIPAVDPNQYIVPAPPEFTRNNIQELNQNRDNGEAEENGVEFETFINPYIYTDTPVPVPTLPPADDPFADNYPVPELNDVPAIVPQPDFPEEPELDPEDAEKSLEMAMPDLKDIFPFCLPWDIYEVFQKFRANRKAPELDWTFESDLFGFSYTLHVDLEDYNTAAEILRLLELIAFIVGLAVATRKLIGA